MQNRVFIWSEGENDMAFQYFYLHLVIHKGWTRGQILGKTKSISVHGLDLLIFTLPIQRFLILLVFQTGLLLRLV
jgi:hypothetical protein